MIFQSLPWVAQNPLIPLLILFGVGLGVGVAASLVGAFGRTDVPSLDEPADGAILEAGDVRRGDLDDDR